MINRENGLIEIYERIKVRKDNLGLKSFKRIPTFPVRKDMLPCVFMHEGVDTILEHSKRNKIGYPAKRILEVTIEIISIRESDIKSLYSDVRKAVFLDKNSNWNNSLLFNSIITENTFINENRTEGPIGYRLPDIIGMSLILDLVYTDKGF